MSHLRVSPAELLRGDGALEALARRLSLSGAAGTDDAAARAEGPVLLVHGTVGYPRVRERLDAALAAAGVNALRRCHEGSCHPAALAGLAAEAERTGAAWVLGVGGGRVIDTAKGAALVAGRPYAALPTSPATCAATAATVVLYDEAGRHQAVREDGVVPAVCALDAGLLAAAPDRLLAAGVADAWAKVHEVRLTGGGALASATGRAAVALLDDLAKVLAEHARAALAAGPGGEREPALLPSRVLVAEAAVLYPGLIGGLAGAEAKLALAHPLHDALTFVDGSHAALHGEKVAFGTLVQIRLAGRDGSDANDDARSLAMRAEAAVYAELGLVCHLEALGCAAARSAPVEDDVVRRTLADSYVQQALPGLEPARLRAAVREVDAYLRGLDRPLRGRPAGAPRP